MTGRRRNRIALALAAIVVAFAAGTAGAGDVPSPEGAAPPSERQADPPWLLLSGVAAAGTLAVGGVAVLWARMLERAGTLTRMR
jgi:hypothetical protein